MDALTKIHSHLCWYFREESPKGDAELLLREIQEIVLKELVEKIGKEPNVIKYFRLGGTVKHKANGKIMVIIDVVAWDRVSCRYETHIYKEFKTEDFYIHELEEYHKSAPNDN